MSSVRWRWRLACLVVGMAVMFAVCVVWASAAFAGYTIRGEVGTGPGDHGGEFWNFGPDGVAVDPSTGDLYAVDGGNARVQKFTGALSPGFLLTYGWGVENGGEEFEICGGKPENCTFGREGSGAGEFGAEFEVANAQAVGVAVDPVSRDSYATDTFNDRVEYFEAGGQYVGQFTGEGTPAGSFSRPRGIVVDAGEHVYVEDTGHNTIDRFSASGSFECQISGQAAPAGQECSGAGSATPDGGLSLAEAFGAGVAVDSSGDVYLADTGHNVVDEFDATGAFVRQFGVGTLSAPQSVAVSATGNVFVGGGSIVYVFKPDGSLLAEFGSGTVGEGFGLASRPAGGIYVADRAAHKVMVYGAFPGIVTGQATSVTTEHATLNGTVNPEGAEVTSCEFEYAPAGGTMRKAPCEQTQAQIGTGSAPVPVSAEVSGLEPDAQYSVRLVAGNAEERGTGAETSFTAIASTFGFQLGGPNALEMLVSNSGTEPGPEHEGEEGPANPADLDTQAGSHPFDVTSRFLVNTESDGNAGPNLRPKDFYVNIPAGFAGSVARIPRCRMSELTQSEAHQVPSGCPTASQVGVVRVFKGREAGTTGVTTGELTPVYNMVPPPGVPAEFAFSVISVGVPVSFQVRSDGNYGITAEVPDISEVLPVIGSQLTLWGVPADPKHDAERFLPEHFQGGSPGDKNGEPLPAGTPEVPFLTNPTRCGAQEEATVTGDSWLHPGQLAEDGRPIPGGENWVTASTPMFPKGITGCEKLTFQPELAVKPETTTADSPTGLTVDLKVPQHEAPNNLATPSLKEAVVTLPQGLAIAPSQARGREGCTLAQIKLGSTAQPECPGRSQIGKLELITPLLPEPLTGQIYLSSERQGNVFHVYLVIEGQGVQIKLEGSVQANEQTGQLTSTFKENPQLPFSELKLTFFGGNDASLATPDACGSYGTTSLLKPWSDVPARGEAHGTPDAEPAVEPFKITTGCTEGFAPGFHAGMENPVAGAYSPFSLAISRNDGEQEVSKLQVSLPKGLVGKLAGIEECSTAQIEHAEHNTGAAEKASPSCPAGSQIGTVQAGAGPGESLFFAPGKAYLTGPYEGAPYGLVVMVPALAGPFDLGTVVVRGAIHIDPHTAQVTVSSDPLPKMLDGIPLQVRRIEASIDRPNFTLNPTNCEATDVTGTLTSFAGAQHAVSARFQVGDCGSLAFKPGFRVATHARHTRRNGEYLRVNVTSGQGANIKSVFVKLPKALPSRTSTLKLACLAKQFEENPAGCPAGSHVGTAIAHTPILSTPLTGPAIFVSHGGAAFPNLDIVLQGSGVTVDLTGNTNIVKGITSSSFSSVPDVPVSSFELTLPAGLHSALAGNGNLCYKTVTKHGHKTRRRVKLTMPTVIIGQNGAVVKQTTHIAVEGCGKAGGHKAGKPKRKRK